MTPVMFASVASRDERAVPVPLTSPRVVVVTVTFDPNIALLRQQLDAVLPQVARVLFVDNGSSERVLGALHQLKEVNPSRVDVLELGMNTGVGHAQNRGVEMARKMDADAVLLLDHDSVPDATMVERLVGAWRAHPDAAALGPWHEDPRRRQRRSPFIQVRGLRQIRVPFVAGSIWPVDHVIASGSLVPLAAVDAVGDFREDYFIDMVDVEWCLRARRLGWGVYGVCDARLSHELGLGSHAVFDLEYAIASPVRTYYQVRNLWRMWSERRAPLNWLLVTTLRMFGRIAIHVLLHPPRKPYMLAVWRGTCDAHAGRMGSMPAIH